MTPQQFRKLALSFPDVVESSHMNHPDFRFQGKIFATLGAPGPEWGMIKLAPAQQRVYCESGPETFVPASGAWGRSGCTSVRLASAGTGTIREALEMAIANFAGPGKKTKPAGKRASSGPKASSSAKKSKSTRASRKTKRRP